MGHVDDLMCVGPRSGLFLAKLKGVYVLTSTFFGPDSGEEEDEKFLARSICWRTDGLTWTGDVKLVKEALYERDVCEAKEVETPGMNDAYDVQGFLIADFMSKESAVKCRRTAAELNHLALDNPLIAFAPNDVSKSMSSPRQGEDVKLKRLLRFFRKRPTTNVSVRVAGSSSRIDWVHRLWLGRLQAPPEIHQWSG